MTLITAKQSTTTSIPNPSKTQLHMFTSPLPRQFLVMLNILTFSKKWIINSQPHIANLYLLETVLTISMHPISRHADSRFNEIIITRTSNFPSYTPNFFQSTIFNAQSADQLRSKLHNLSLKCNGNDNITFFTS